MTITIEVDLPDDLNRFQLPAGVAARLQGLLDRQDSGQPLSPQERKEAEGLVTLSELLTLLRLRVERRELERRRADSFARPDAVTPWLIVKARALARARQ